ncbi:MAG: hypothetical protein HY403_10775 [Elusimicrobia bacterium]|nr:hypothetical protein [Elusimicrobiota bacterium]
MARLIPAVLASIVLGAHFLRRGGLTMVGFCLAAPIFVLLVRRRWALRTFQGFLGFGTLIWISTAIGLGKERMSMDQPFLRMALIMGSVAVFTALSAWLLGRKALLERYR